MGDHGQKATSDAADRRRFLRAGGAGAVAAAAATVLGACGESAVSGEPEPVRAQRTGTTTTSSPDEPPPTVGEQPPDQTELESDLATLRSLTSIEFAVGNGYGAILSSGESGGVAFTNLTNLLREHHQLAAATYQQSTRAHLRELQRSAPDDFGQLDPATIVYEPGDLDDPNGNAYLWNDFITPQVAELDSEASVIRLARDMEDVCAATAVIAVGTLTTPELRSTAMSISSAEARHSAVLARLLVPAEMGAPQAVFNTRDALGVAGQLTFDGSPAPSAG